MAALERAALPATGSIDFLGVHPQYGKQGIAIC